MSPLMPRPNRSATHTVARGNDPRRVSIRTRSQMPCIHAVRVSCHRDWANVSICAGATALSW